MINPLEAVANLAKPVVMQVLVARERLESGVAYNPVSDEVARDPYAVYRRLRDKDPVHRMRLIDAWILTRYEHADSMLRDHERFGGYYYDQTRIAPSKGERWFCSEAEARAAGCRRSLR